MRIFRSSALAILCMSAVAFSQSGRVALPDIGVSIWVPDGWLLSKDTAANSYYWEDTTTTGYRGVIGVQAYDSAWVNGTRDWVLSRAQALTTTVETDPQSLLYAVDSTSQGGHFAMYVNYQTEFIDTTGSLAEDFHDRFTAWGQTGYDLYAYGDSADFASNFTYYSAILDSIVLDNSFTSLGSVASAIAPRSGSVTAFSIRDLANGSVEFRLDPAVPANQGRAANVVVCNFQGRVLWSSGLTVANPVAWKPAFTGAGAYLVRITQGRDLLGSSMLVRVP
jgi:hypothetical protein